LSFTGNYICTSFKRECLIKGHDFTTGTGDVFKMALYDSGASLNASTTAYTTSNEISGTGYSAGGFTLTNVTPVESGTAAISDFEDVNAQNCTFTCRGALIYNYTAGGNAVAVYDFGANKSPVNQRFLATMPAFGAQTAIIRLI